jgi:hypothetical protein
VVGYSRLAAADEDRTLARLRALRSDLIDPTIAVHNGRVVKRTGDGILIEFRSVVDAVRCAIEVQNGMVERNAGLPPERRIGEGFGATAELLPGRTRVALRLSARKKQKMRRALQQLVIGGVWVMRVPNPSVWLMCPTSSSLSLPQRRRVVGYGLHQQRTNGFRRARPQRCVTLRERDLRWASSLHRSLFDGDRTDLPKRGQLDVAADQFAHVGVTLSRRTSTQHDGDKMTAAAANRRH